MKFTEKLKKNAQKVALTVSTAVMMAPTYVKAEMKVKEASTMMETLFGYVGGAVAIIGAIVAVGGLIGYISADAEGSGPEKHKAQKQMGGGAALIAVGLALATLVKTLISSIPG